MCLKLNSNPRMGATDGIEKRGRTDLIDLNSRIDPSFVKNQLNRFDPFILRPLIAGKLRHLIGNPNNICQLPKDRGCSMWLQQRV